MLSTGTSNNPSHSSFYLQYNAQFRKHMLNWVEHHCKGGFLEVTQAFNSFIPSFCSLSIGFVWKEEFFQELLKKWI